jgi:two-component system, cell cycle sensor histidine kinase and response regulator CckA
MLLREAQAGGFLRGNRGFYEDLGVDAEALAREPLTHWIHPEDRAAFDEVLSKGTGSLRARHRDAQGGWVSMSWEIQTEPEGTLVLGRRSVDDTSPCEETKSSIGKGVRADSDTLAAMVRYIEAINLGMKSSVLILDESGNHVSVGAGPSLPAEYNEAVEGLAIGPTVGSCGTAAYWGVPVIVEDIQADPLWRNLKEHAARAGLGACWSHPVLCAQGEVLGAVALYSPEPRRPSEDDLRRLRLAAGMVGVELERAEARRRESELEEQLRHTAKMEALGVLAGGIAHDFNNMLGTILGNAEISMAELGEASAAQPMLADIVTACHCATDLCNQMLAFAGRGVISTECFDVNAAVRELASLLQSASSKKTTVEYRLADEALFVEANKSQLQQVVMNLLTNANEAIGEDLGRIVVMTEARHHDLTELRELAPHVDLEAAEYVRVVVSDTGCGMTAETQERVFDPFYSTKTMGRGLGLATVQGIVNRHGGTIHLESRVGEGTRFLVLLPRAVSPSLPLDRSPQAARTQESKGVLVVDDERALLASYERMLRHGGFEVFTAADGAEAVEVLRTHHAEIDCVVLDLSMPKLNGEETFHQLREIDADVRVIINSGYTEEELLQRFHGTGFAGFLQKPVPMKTLLFKIDEAIREAPRG